ncbi:MAG: undecaprenyl-phosphate galactose phosphotransferase WbaP [Desulfomicrobium sp.]|nr:undecaprenyl-phosphate galactose phosphotransferase WbaP [Pseudomonadota bacterium]MBU4571988.1 undecaprenyl-phosphate galactose phosphotransferase WbaP [Pseudomonadota bacterium]MBU4596137.1 undecaprenyl-phosphate galactose phosphotransferase WbaP [Pseudomonadota bacterium]MBV1748647.1 undecaprenyl-phosphate galactose phosphotransferase WbaP [Desulfomicrobium sp.]
MTGIFALSDLLGLLLVWCLSVWIRLVFDGQFGLLLYWNLVPCLGLYIVSNALVGLYPGILLSPPEELKKLSQSTSVIFLAMTGAVFFSKQGELYSRGIFLMAWLGALLVLPLFRSLLRRHAHAKDWWGHPVVILGAGKTGREVCKALAREHRLGLRPVAFFDDDPAKIGTHIHGVPVEGPLHSAGNLASEYRDAVAIVAMPGVLPARLVEILEGPASEFRRLILIPDLFGAASLWISAFDLGGILGLEVHQKLLDPRRQWLKRCMELGLIFVFLPIILLLSLAIAIWIKKDSTGPVLFCQKRIGLDGKDIVIWKFRTMVQEAGEVLEECLATDSDMRAEWDQNHKLTCDPRITRVGRILRKTSLDELPQLWNVLRGDLSLVGPRPIVWDEVVKYQGGFALYKKVKPGLTGLWQVSGRSDTTYAERVRLDAYYVRNWSIWFDIYILLKTPGEVFRCRGAC